MGDFKFLENKSSKKWIILAPRRAKRPDVAREASPLCPFCPGKEENEQEIYRVPARNASQPTSQAEQGGQGASEEGWQVRVIPNKFPFAPIHELIIHSPDHHKNFDELPVDHVATIVQVYRQRYNNLKNSGQVYIFHNRGEAGGESLPHPHTQLTVIPNEVVMDIPILPSQDLDKIETSNFYVSCPPVSQWPDETWIYPKVKGRVFGEISDEEILDLATIINKLIKILDLRHGHEFPFNFYIYPGNNWYMRVIPRVKSLGGFEVGTGIFVNTQDPHDTFLFLKEHFDIPDEEKIRRQYQAEYSKHA